MLVIDRPKEGEDWSRWKEIRQRLTNCKMMLLFAWLALRYPSFVFSSVLLNSVRSEGDGMISRITERGTRVTHDIIPDKPN